jgi:pantothenate kinase
MDGFHLATRLLTPEALNRRGAIDTFDGGGYLALLRRIAARDEEIVYAPSYQRGLEEPIAGAIAVPRSTRVVITEGNYLLADAPYWRDIRSLLDEIWLVETPTETRLARLATRHASFGMDESSARRWAEGPDETNARLVARTSHLADRVIPWG